jgi:hypothetical protein
MDHKEELEGILTAELLKREPQASQVTVSFDGHSAAYRVRDMYRLRKLSNIAREFLRDGGDIAIVDQSLFEGWTRKRAQ